MKIIFLDIDGVMKSHASTIRNGRDFGMDVTLHPEHVEALNFILEHTDARIVVSSTWRWGFSVTELKEMFSRSGVHYKYVISKTPTTEDMFRGDEVDMWLETAPQDAFIYHGVELDVESYVILDDDDDFDGVQKAKHFVQTDARYGLTHVEALKAIEILNGKPLLPTKVRGI